MTSHPDPAAIRAAMDKLEVVADKYDCAPVDMGVCDVSRSPECGTVACHGGLYALAYLNDSPRVVWNADEHCDETVFAWASGEDIVWSDGATMLARDLGFFSIDGLTAWASTYPQVWGNNYGDCMFDSAGAFIEAGETLTVQDIIAHWRGVADRIEMRG